MNITTKKEAKSKTDLGIRPSQNRETPDFLPSRPFKESTFLNRRKTQEEHPQTFSPISTTTGRSCITNFSPSPPSADEKADASNMLVDPMPPPTSTTMLPLGNKCQSNPNEAHIFRKYPQCRPSLARTTKNSAWCLPGPSARHSFAESF